MALIWLSAITKITRHLSLIKLSRVKLIVTEPIGLCFFSSSVILLMYSYQSLLVHTQNIAQDEFFFHREVNTFQRLLDTNEKWLTSFVFLLNSWHFGASFCKDFAVVRTRETLCGISNLRSSIDWKCHVEIEPWSCSSLLYFFFFQIIKYVIMSNVKKEKSRLHYNCISLLAF